MSEPVRPWQPPTGCPLMDPVCPAIEQRAVEQTTKQKISGWAVLIVVVIAVVTVVAFLLYWVLAAIVVVSKAIARILWGWRRT